MQKKLFKVRSEVWLYPGQTSNWHFVSLPRKQSDTIKKEFSGVKRGWGSLPVRVTLGKTTWKTSIFPDKKENTYLLPLKADVRRKEGVRAGESVSLVIEIVA